MTPRFFFIFAVLFLITVFGEWFAFLKGFNFSYWTFSNWMLGIFALLIEAGAIAIITAAIDKALPASGNRAPTRDAKQARRATQKYSAR